MYGLTEKQLEVVKNCQNVYFKLLSMIQYALINQNKRKLIYGIFKEANGISNYEEKLIYLLKVYLNIVGWEYLHILSYLGIPEDIIKGTFKISNTYSDDTVDNRVNSENVNYKSNVIFDNNILYYRDNERSAINKSKSKLKYNGVIKKSSNNHKQKVFFNFILNRNTKRGR